MNSRADQGRYPMGLGSTALAALSTPGNSLSVQKQFGEDAGSAPGSRSAWTGRLPAGHPPGLYLTALLGSVARARKNPNATRLIRSQPQDHELRSTARADHC